MWAPTSRTSTLSQIQINRDNNDEQRIRASAYISLFKATNTKHGRIPCPSPSLPSCIKQRSPALALQHTRLSLRLLSFFVAMAACSSMASGVAANSFSILGASSVPVRAISRSTGFAKVSFSKRRTVFSSLHTSRRASALKIVCAAKKETVDKVCSIVKSQLALTDDKPLTPESKFTELGADSLDTVEIVMALEEEFKITVEEENAGSITTVQEAADLIERLVQAGSQSAKA